MATRQALTPAAVNRRLDAMNRKKNPARKRTRAQWLAEIATLQNMVKTGENRDAYNHARYLYDEASDDYSKAGDEAQAKIRKIMEDLNEQRYGNPGPKSAKKTRRVTVVAANPAKRPKVLYQVWTVAADGIKHERLALFEKISEAKKYAQAYADSSGKQIMIEEKPL